MNMKENIATAKARYASLTEAERQAEHEAYHAKRKAERETEYTIGVPAYTVQQLEAIGGEGWRNLLADAEDIATDHIADGATEAVKDFLNQNGHTMAIIWNPNGNDFHLIGEMAIPAVLSWNDDQETITIRNNGTEWQAPYNRIADTNLDWDTAQELLERLEKLERDANRVFDNYQDECDLEELTKEIARDLNGDKLFNIIGDYIGDGTEYQIAHRAEYRAEWHAAEIDKIGSDEEEAAADAMEWLNDQLEIGRRENGAAFVLITAGGPTVTAYPTGNLNGITVEVYENGKEARVTTYSRQAADLARLLMELLEMNE